MNTENAYEEEVQVDETELDVYAKPPSEVDDNAPSRSWEELISAWMTVQDIGDMSNWTLGDIANDVIRVFGNTKDADGRTPLDKFSEDVGQKPGTVRQYAWVSRMFDTRLDRQTGLSWSHYRAVVRTETPRIWIDEAVKNNWSVRQLEEQVKNVQDGISEVNGRPCDVCGGQLPENGAYHIRQGNQKVASLCCERCGVQWFLQKAQEQEKTKLEAAA